MVPADNFFHRFHRLIYVFHRFMYFNNKVFRTHRLSCIFFSLNDGDPRTGFYEHGYYIVSLCYSAYYCLDRYRTQNPHLDTGANVGPALELVSVQAWYNVLMQNLWHKINFINLKHPSEQIKKFCSLFRFCPPVCAFVCTVTTV